MAIFENQGLKTATYPYWANETKSLDLNGFLNAIQKAPEGSIFVLHSCAHNPTGLDPTSEQWVQIVDAIASKNHIALFDTAYQGFATGDLDKDAYAVRLGVEKLSTVSPVFVCQSFAKNAGMYGERVGCFHLALTKQAQNKTIKPAVTSQLAKIIRSEVSNPPPTALRLSLNCWKRQN